MDMDVSFINMEVSPWNMEVSPRNMEVSPWDLKRLCGDRFRVLIIGRRNAGKTTILEKMTGSEEGAMPEIRDRGRLVV